MSRLGPERLEELYLGTLALVAERGFDNLTMDQVAEATQSSKATLYRQWGSKAALVAAAMHSITVADDAPIETGSLRGDLVQMIRRRSRSMEDQGALVGALLHACKQDADLRTALHEQILAVARRRLRQVLDQAVDRGELAADHPALPYLDLVLFAPFVLREVLDDEPADETYLVGYVDAVLLPALGIT